MNKPFMPPAGKRATNVSLREDLVAEAKGLGIGLSQACEAGLADAVRKVREAKWLEENKAALDWSNDYVARNGLPLAKHRMF